MFLVLVEAFGNVELTWVRCVGRLYSGVEIEIAGHIVAVAPQSGDVVVPDGGGVGVERSAVGG